MFVSGSEVKFYAKYKPNNPSIPKEKHPLQDMMQLLVPIITKNSPAEMPLFVIAPHPFIKRNPSCIQRTKMEK